MKYAMFIAGGFCGAALCDLVFHTGSVGQLIGAYAGGGFFLALWTCRHELVE